MIVKRYIGNRLVSDEEFSQTVITNPDILEVIYQAKSRIEAQMEEPTYPPALPAQTSFSE